ncbi:Uncharacterised protein [Bordetella pertussis]|nr:Uncharacterised protein [Bordetella pertussis]
MNPNSSNSVAGVTMPLACSSSRRASSSTGGTCCSTARPTFLAAA